MVGWRKVTCLAAGTVVGVGSLIAGASPVVAGAASLPETYTTLSSGTLNVTTTHHIHAKLSFVATRRAAVAGKSNAGRPSTLAITLAQGGESHTWQFALKGGAFTENGLKGQGHVSSGKKEGKFGSTSITFSALSAKQVDQCDSLDLDISHKVQINGKLKLKTHSAWGNWSGKVKFRKAQLVAGHGEHVTTACEKLPCPPALSWVASSTGTSLSGASTAAGGQVTASRSTKLGIGSDTRIDAVTVTAPAPVLSMDGTTLTIATSGHGASGSATLTGTNSSHYAVGCTKGQVSGTRFSASFEQGANPIVVHEAVFGSLTMPSTNTASYLTTTSSGVV